MTALQTRPRVLTAADADALCALISRDEILNCVLDSRLQVAPSLDSRELGGFVWGLDDPADGRLRAALFHGGNLIPVGEDVTALQALAERLSRNGRGCSSIVGAAVAVSAIWPTLSRSWGPARSIRGRQPLLLADRPAPIRVDPAVRPVHRAELAAFLPAAVAMFTEELGISPLGRDRGASYRSRVAEVIGAGRAFARFDDRGAVEFKAEIGAQSGATAQVQGVWVRPDLRGRGIGTAAMGAVLDLVLQHSPTVSLYVNDYNAPARRMYERLGFRQAGTLSTVLF
ncbi:GNAT family N-acetyltransferase [soil metagenome]